MTKGWTTVASEKIKSLNMTGMANKKCRLAQILAASVIILLFLSGQSNASDQQTILMLEGNSCSSHPEEIKKVLAAVPGVKSIDLDKMPGHAIVVHDESVKSDSLAEAIKDAKGTNDDGAWFCAADVMEARE
jgi:copper chaperone CopZ